MTTPENPALSVLDGIKLAILVDATIDFFVHGTTVGLNALLTRRGAKFAPLPTHSFRDIYTIQGNDRGQSSRSAETNPNRWPPCNLLALSVAGLRRPVRNWTR